MDSPCYISGTVSLIVLTNRIRERQRKRYYLVCRRIFTLGRFDSDLFSTRWDHTSASQKSQPSMKHFNIFLPVRRLAECSDEVMLTKWTPTNADIHGENLTAFYDYSVLRYYLMDYTQQMLGIFLSDTNCCIIQKYPSTCSRAAVITSSPL